MGGASVIAAALTDHSAHTFGIFVGGLDVSKQPTGTLGQRYGVPIETLKIEEVYGGVGSCEFDVEDRLKVLAFTPGTEVWVWDLSLNKPHFGGILDRVDKRPDGGNQGVVWSLTASDWNCLLDRRVVQAVTVVDGLSYLSPGGTTRYYGRRDWALSLAAASGLRAFGNDSAASTTDQPCAFMDIELGLGWDAHPRSGFSVGDGTLRSALEQMQESVTALTGVPQDSTAIFVDLYKGLRGVYGPGNETNDVPYTGNAAYHVDEVTAGKIVEDLVYTIDATNVVNAVYVRGANANGSGWVLNQGSILAFGRRETAITVSDSNTTVKRDNAGNLYLKRTTGANIRGSYTTHFDPWGATTNLRVGMRQTITNAELGLVTAFSVVQRVSTTFTGGQATYSVDFGGKAVGTASTLLRSLKTQIT